MSLVTLVSGGLDSTLMSVLCKEANVLQFPLFIDYGQRFKAQELAACRRNLRQHSLPPPTVLQAGGFGKVFRTGLTDSKMDVVRDAFVPNRNLLFLLCGTSHAFQMGADAVAIGLLNECNHIFPDQTVAFVQMAEMMLQVSLGKRIKVITPLAEFTKQDVLALSAEKGIKGTYSCHVGGPMPCGKCISCREFETPED